ncbi:MAG: hypothetical protein QOK05_552 [Chloroflexota bacterium]|nr:hypothetical protein [Chloroflexota bacterium]
MPIATVTVKITSATRKSIRVSRWRANVVSVISFSSLG